MRAQKIGPVNLRRISFISLFLLSVIILSIPCRANAGEPESAPNIDLIKPSELNENPSAWIVLDARPTNVWAKEHIKGALSFCWEQYTRTDEKGIPYRMQDPEKMAESLGKLGLNENSPVVVYGDADTSWGGEGWSIWVLSFMGHKGKIRLLDGGIQGWKKSGLTTASGNEPVKFPETKYLFNPRNSILIKTDALEKNGADFQKIDTRSFVEWIKGHIDGAKRIEWTNFYEGDERRPISPEKLKQLLSSNGVVTAKPVVYYCTGGVRSAYAWLVHQLAGLPSAMNYEEGMVAWEKR